MKIIVVNDYKEMSKEAAVLVKKQIEEKETSVLGLATGSTPIGMYKELIEFCKKGEIDFSKVQTFNLDEYYGLNGENEQSYHYYMNNNFFGHINIKAENTHIPNGMSTNIEEECRNYEFMIESCGGIDLQILGIGNNGHIGFNEPGSSLDARTQLVDLKEKTIEANSRFFESKDEVPKKALSMGIRTIMNAKKIVLLASGDDKADAIYRTVQGKIDNSMPASILQLHPNVTIILDKAAARLLK